MKVAACLRAGPIAGVRNVERMLYAQRAREAHRSHVVEVDGAALGFVSTSESHSPISLFRRSQSGNLLLVTGTPFSLRGSLERKLEEVCRNDYQGAACLLSELDGAFAALFWDNTNRRLVVVTDFLGLQPLYLAEAEGSLLLASELKGIAAARQTVEMDAAGWGAFVSLGHFLGETTSLAGVRRVAGGAVVTYDAASGTLDQRQYWQWTECRSGNGHPVDTGAIVGTLQREMEAYSVHHSPGTVLLSGGFDSRLILSLLRRMGVRPKALAVAHPGERLDSDGRFARRVAERLGVPCEFRTPPAGFYASDAFLDYMILNEVASPSLHLFIAQVSTFIKPELGAVWEGVGPGYSLAFPRIRKPSLGKYISQRCQPRGAPIRKAADLLFAPAKAEAMRTSLETTLATEAASCPPGDIGLLQFEVRHQMRNRMGHNPIKVYSNDVLCFTPGVSREFWNLTAAIPYAIKWNFHLYFEIFQRHFPEALDVPFCSMGQLWSSRLTTDPQYHLARLFPPPGANYAANVLKRMGVGWKSSSLVRRVVSRVDPGHPDLCADSVVRLQRDETGDAVRASARSLLFYWQVWRWIMEGRLSTSQKQVLTEEIQ